MQKTLLEEIINKKAGLDQLAKKYHVAAIKVFGNVLGNRFLDPADIHLLITPAPDANQIHILNFEKDVKELFYRQITKLYTEESLKLMVEQKMLSDSMRQDAINTAVGLDNLKKSANEPLQVESPQPQVGQGGFFRQETSSTNTESVTRTNERNAMVSTIQEYIDKDNYLASYIHSHPDVLLELYQKYSSSSKPRTS